MWSIADPSLSESPSGSGSICSLDLGYSNLPLVQVDFDADWRLPGVVSDHEPITLAIEIDPMDQTLTIPEEVEIFGLTILQVAGETYTAAEDLDNPQPGEFTLEFAESANSGLLDSQPIRKVKLHNTTPQSGKGTLLAQKRRSAIPTNLVPSTALGALAKLPVTGKVSWSLSIEQHPSGSFQIACTKPSIGMVRDRLKNGTEIELFGIGFAISNLQEKLELQGYYTLSASLTGKWAKPQYNDPSYLHINNALREDSGEIDSECNNPVAQEIAEIVRQRPTRVSIATLAARVRVPFQPVDVDGDAPWSTRIPPNAPRNAAQVWSSDLTQRCRINNAFIDWAQAGAVVTRSLDSGKRWNYQVPDLSITYQGSCQNSPDHKGYATEYKNAELTGTFTTRLFRGRSLTAKPLGLPKWKPATPSIKILRQGDRTYLYPPDTLKVLRTMSNNFDASGDTKTLKIPTIINGRITSEIEKIYGFKYQSWDVYSEYDDAPYYTTPADFWGLVSFKKKIYLYDKIYGFPIGYTTKGWKYVRFQQESDSMEGLNFDPEDPIDYKSYVLYVFRKVPIIERSRERIVPFSQFYANSNDQSAWASYKHCNPDGTSETRFLRDPTWAPASFSIANFTYTSCFTYTLNPEFEPGAEYSRTELPPKKYLLAGDQNFDKKTLLLLPAKPAVGSTYLQPNGQGGIVLEDGKVGDRFIERNIQDSTSNNYNFKAVLETFTENEGQPSPVSPSAPLREKVEPSKDDDPRTLHAGDKAAATQYHYLITTPGYSPTDPINGSVGYEVARTVQSALTAAKAQLKLDDIQQSVQYSFQVPFNPAMRPLDRITVTAQGETHSVVVSSISNSFNLEGQVGKLPILTWEPTQITAGINRTIPVDLHRQRIPPPPKAPSTTLDPGRTEEDPTAPRNPIPWDITLGQLFPNNLIRGRGNF